ncbi:MAG TPA: hypothetical protein VFE62_00850 [Gemmataceae bacterium]|nr:hypothetical protein [Gemmataceae bacterium]
MQTTTERLNGQPLKLTPDRRDGQQRIAFKLPKADKVLFLAAAGTPWALAILLLAVSTPHLAGGFQTICQCGPLAGWLLAIAIDAAQVTAKLQMTVLKGYATTETARWTAVGIVCGTSLMSMALNVLAFLAGATDATGTVLAWTMGVMLPLLVLALSYTGSAFALAKAKRAPKAKGKTK